MRKICKQAAKVLALALVATCTVMSTTMDAKASDIQFINGTSVDDGLSVQTDVDSNVTIGAGAIEHDLLVQLDDEELDVLAEGVEEGVIVEETEEAVEEPAVIHIFANVSDSANVREEPSEDATKVGKLFKDCSGTLLEQQDGWSKIESGKLIGWVSNDFLLFGEEADAKIAEVGTLKATILTDSLRVRKEPSQDAGVYKLVGKDDTFTVTEELDGWVAIKLEQDTGYISSEYVSVEFTTEVGKTLQQIDDEARAAELKKLSKNQGAVPTSVSDVTLLAALIQAEAGTQPYEGKLAVGAVVMNRVRSGGYPNTILGVITQPSQFPPATNGTVAGIVARGPSQSCMQAAQAAVNGQTNVGGALHFGRVGKAAGVVIGGHVFY